MTSDYVASVDLSETEFTMIRAKFKCMSVLLSWDGGSVAELQPVYAKSGGNHEENKLFWKYTPSGKAELHFKGKTDMVPGALYFIDMEPSQDGLWKLNRTSHWGTAGEGDVEFYTAADGYCTSWGRLSMNLSGESAKVADFGPTGAMWKVTFSPAPDDL